MRRNASQKEMIDAHRNLGEGGYNTEGALGRHVGTGGGFESNLVESSRYLNTDAQGGSGMGGAGTIFSSLRAHKNDVAERQRLDRLGNRSNLAKIKRQAIAITGTIQTMDKRKAREDPR